MNTKPKNWVVHDQIPDEVSQDLGDYPAIFKQVLYNRGILDKTAAESFLQADEPRYPASALKGILTAVDLIWQKIQEKKRILVFGDYDVDGVTATALLVELLGLYKANVEQYIPNRFDEGYGFSMLALEGARERQPDLIITVDCGVRSLREVAEATRFGIATIITDHHQPLEELPLAAAVICPRQMGDEYPNKELAGVGIAYKLAEAMLKRYPLEGQSAEQWLDLVALGTVADMASLTGENRVLVRNGIERMRAYPRPGVQALARVSGVNLAEMSAQHIGFRLGPRLNAAGRMETALAALELLLAPSFEEALPRAHELDIQNQDRQEKTKEIQNAVAKTPGLLENNWLIFSTHEDFHEGVLGLAASRLAEAYYRPAIIGAEKDGSVRASCRSISEVNITAALDECRELLLQHGGHAMAAGLSIRAADMEDFRAELTSVIQRMSNGEPFTPRLSIDALVTLKELATSNILPSLESLEPTGADNPVPMFMAEKVEVVSVASVGKEKEHLRMTLRDSGDPKGAYLNAIAFRYGHLLSQPVPGEVEVLDHPTQFPKEENKPEPAFTIKAGDCVDIAFNFELNIFNGNKSPQANIREIRPT